MTAANFDKLMKPLMGIEGGVSDRPLKADPGGLTSHGVTWKVYDRYRDLKGLPRQSVKLIKQAEVREIAKTMFWDTIRGDDLPSGLDWAMFDFCFNSGPSQPIRELQRVLGTNVDGVLGPATMALVEKADTATTINHLCDRRLAFMKTLKNWSANKNGWPRRVAEVRSSALEMATAQAEPTVVLPSLPDTAQAKADPAKQAQLKTPEGVGLTVTAAAVGGEKVRQLAETVQPHASLDTVLGRLAFAVFTLLMLIGGGLVAFSYIKRIQEKGGLGGFVGSVFKGQTA